MSAPKLLSSIRRRGVISLTSWFHHPSINQRFEVLCRGSGTCVTLSNDNNSSSLLSLLVSHHVVSPFRFPQHYEQPFLSSLKEEHVRFSVELRDFSDGNIISQIRLDPTFSKVFAHEVRDVAALPLPRRSLDLLLKGANVFLQPVKLSNTPVNEGLELDFIGHFVKPSVDENTGEDISTLVPKNVHGRVQLRARQTFASTSEVLEMGFCGGAVLLKRKTSGGKIEKEEGIDTIEIEEEEECVGIVEGIVPLIDNKVSLETTNTTNSSNTTTATERAKKILQGCAVFVEADDCRELVKKCVSGSARQMR